MPRRTDHALTAGGKPRAFGARIRQRIDSTMILDKLQRVAHGEDEMTAVQFQAAKLLLQKTVPDLKAVEVKQPDAGNAKSISNQGLLNVIEGEIVSKEDSK